MSNQTPYTIQQVGYDHKQIVYADEWNNHESVWSSEKCWYTDGEFVVTNLNTGEAKTFVR